MRRRITIFGLEGIPEVIPGDDVGKLIVASLRRNRITLTNNDIIVVTQKIISKAENRLRELRSVLPDRYTSRLARRLQKDPRHLKVVMDESKRVVRAKMGVIITETLQGLICANSGVDQSNVVQGTVSLLPKDPDLSARRIRRRILKETGRNVAVIISDTFGRPFREGHTDVAIGVSGMRPIRDYRGKRDTFGNEMRVTNMAVADELASATELVRGKLERIPVAVVRGYAYPKGRGSASDLVMAPSKNLFR